ncbi:hypothetical protein ACFQI7_30405 [Paenibacillus allorhizosphaerae]|uniref:Uncharacterized protein n=1 Tax=Paenibacillus allorhizosphaerae TaxID=2849866 RepID=A0ABN7TMI1_9BACL|nr:hypothetical protein [Paenibacillus allorhizosphaerae]CAG7640584.1 hypothetical protein PAECIP111802_02663 [Paenibacillus allorhizosphaerae]
MKANPADQSIKYFVGTGQGNRFEARNLTFVGYSTALEISTADVDVSMMELNNVIFHMCKTGLDTISFAASRSTVLTVRNCISWKTDLVIKSHCDMTLLDNCWMTHSGYNGPAIYNDSHLNINGGIYVPLKAQTDADPRWIDNYETGGEHGLFIDGVRFGGEGGGGYPIVFNYVAADLNLANHEGNVISIENTHMVSVGTPRKSSIVLFNIPNRISIRNSNGFKDLLKGIISCDAAFDPDTIPHSPYITIDLDETVFHSPNFPTMDARLARFAAGRRFRKTFPALPPGQVQAVSAGAGKAKVTFDVQQLNGAAYTDQRQLGFSLLVVTTAGGSDADTGSKCVSTLVITCTGGSTDAGVVKRLGITMLSSQKGGPSFADDADIVSVHWGDSDSGSADQAKSDTNTKVTVVFNANGDMRVAAAAFTPLHGM